MVAESFEGWQTAAEDALLYDLSVGGDHLRNVTPREFAQRLATSPEHSASLSSHREMLGKPFDDHRLPALVHFQKVKSMRAAFV